MKFRRPVMHAWFAGLALISASAGTGLAQSSILLETTYLPTSTIVSSPMMATSLQPTSYVVPTAYSPTYLSTSYLAPTSYVTTRYRPRRFVERTSYFASPSYPLATTSYLSPASYLLPTSYVASSYLPTTYLSSSSYLPTSYVTSSGLIPTTYVLDSGLIATSAAVSSPICCDTSPAPVQATTIRQTAPPADSGSATGGSIMSKPAGSSNERSPSAANVDPAIEDRSDSSVKPAGTPANPTPALPSRPAPAGGTGTGTGTASPPAAPSFEEKDPSQIPLPGPGVIGGSGSRPSETMYRARKPSSYPEVRNILKGRVISYDSGRPEEGVTVVVTNLGNTFSDRTAMSDADGEFKLSLPEGDWSVKVQMPSGRVVAVGREYVTATSGKVTDASGRNVKELVITR